MWHREVILILDILPGSLVQLVVEAHDQCREREINLGVSKAVGSGISHVRGSRGGDQEISLCSLHAQALSTSFGERDQPFV